MPKSLRVQSQLEAVLAAAMMARENLGIEMGLGSGPDILEAHRHRCDETHSMLVKALQQTGTPSVNEVKYFRWAYALLVALAKRCLVDAHTLDDEWPQKMNWADLGATSRSSFLIRAREEARIPEDEFLEPIRSGRMEVMDLFDDPRMPGDATLLQQPVDGTEIPVMDDPMGKHWEQPRRDSIRIVNGRAYMSQETFACLHTYNRSIPTGAYPGKMWRMLDEGTKQWWLRWYGPEVAGRCKIYHARIRIGWPPTDGT